MMERLTAYDRPFFGRADNLTLGPLNVAEVGRALGLGPADAIDAHLVSGELPGILRTWPHGMPVLEFLRRESGDPGAAEFGVPEAALPAEFPDPDVSRRVLEAVGAGDRTHAGIAAAAGSRAGVVPSGALSPLLHRLVPRPGSGRWSGAGAAGADGPWSRWSASHWSWPRWTGRCPGRRPKRSVAGGTGDSTRRSISRVPTGGPSPGPCSSQGR